MRRRSNEEMKLKIKIQDNASIHHCNHFFYQRKSNQFASLSSIETLVSRGSHQRTTAAAAAMCITD
jgi:hypothetical protein